MIQGFLLAALTEFISYPTISDLEFRQRSAEDSSPLDSSSSASSMCVQAQSSSVLACDLGFGLAAEPTAAVCFAQRSWHSSMSPLASCPYARADPSGAPTQLEREREEEFASGPLSLLMNSVKNNNQVSQCAGWLAILKRTLTFSALTAASELVLSSLSALSLACLAGAHQCEEQPQAAGEGEGV